MLQRNTILILVLLAIGTLFCLHSVSYAADPAGEPAEEEEAPTNVKDKNGPDGLKSGDTYNFYFQKGSGAKKVKQGKTQEVDQENEEGGESPTAPPAKKSETEAERVADLSIGLASMPGKSASGFTVGGQYIPKGLIGARLGLFILAGPKSGDSGSSFSAFGTNESSTSSKISGGDLGITFNFVNKPKFRLAPALGVLLFDDKSTTTTHKFSAFGSEDGSTSNSNFHADAYIGISATTYFSDNLGANLTALLPSEFKYFIASVNFVYSF